MNYLKNLKLNKKKSALLLSVLLLVFVGILIFIRPVSANIIDTADDIGKRALLAAIGTVLQLVVLIVGTLTTIIVAAIMMIAPYNNFINEPSIVMAWTIIRDFCNMFFILILLVIAFATILRIESYNMKKWLPKLLIMAVLINFSRTIAGLIIDFSQVFMLTFASAIGDTGGPIMNSLGIQAYFDIQRHKITDGTFTEGAFVDFSGILLGMVLGTLFLIIATIVLAIFLAILIMRMAMLWIYVVLSPLAFLLAAFPGGQKYSSRWWDEFIKNVITGPILMFFFWLALITSNNITAHEGFQFTKCIASSETTCPSTFMHFFIAIGMLMGGLIITSQAGGAGSGLAGKGQAMISNSAKGFAGRVTGYDYAKRTGQGYLAMRQSNRNEKIRLSSEKLANTVGIAKQATVGRIGGLGTAAKNKTWNYLGKNQADKLRGEAKRDEQKLEEIKHGMKSLKPSEIFTDVKGDSYKKINDNSWINQKSGSIETVGSHEKDIKAKKIDAKKAEDRQEKANRYMRNGLGVAGAVTGAYLTSGASLVMMGAGAGAGYLAGKRGLPKATGAIANAGNEDISLASNFRNKQVSDAREKVKTQDSESLQATIDDSTKDIFTRVAAAIETLSRGEMSTDDARERKEWIQDKMGGRAKNGDWNDKRLGYTVDSIIDQYNPGAGNRFEKAYDPVNTLQTRFGYTPEEAIAAKEKAQRDISGSYASGALTMEKNDTQSLLMSMNQLVTSLKTGNFVKQFKALTSEAKRTQIVERLKEINTPEGNEKLAHITDINTAYGADDKGKKSFVAGLNPKQIMEIIDEGDAKKLQAIKDVVKNVNDLSINVQNVIKAESPSGKTIKKIFEV